MRALVKQIFVRLWLTLMGVVGVVVLIGALVALADAAAPIAGRKNLLLFSSGFGRLSPSGVPESKRFEPMIQSLNAANVAVYAADLLPPESEHPWSATISTRRSTAAGDSEREAAAGGVPRPRDAQHRIPADHRAGPVVLAHGR